MGQIDRRMRLIADAHERLSISISEARPAADRGREFLKHRFASLSKDGEATLPGERPQLRYSLAKR